MAYDAPPPGWLWRLTLGGAALLAAGIMALALALLGGAADPPRAGPLLWQDDFKSGSARWTWTASPGATVAPEAGALVATFTAAGQTVAGISAAPPGAFTLEIAGAQTAGAAGAAYGLVLDWGGPAWYTAVLINGNGYAEVFQQAGAARTDAYAWQQWPHILYGAESNRVRVDAAGGRLTVRVNDEWLGEFARPAPDPGGDFQPAAGQFGVLARSAGPGRVVFSWVRVWAAP
ncbi:MAG: hypothetical protein KA764_09320 [Anaerolineales bacterium]|nr:hypothetical protein [Anaerolineales bacterium]